MELLGGGGVARPGAVHPFLRKDGERLPQGIHDGHLRKRRERELRR